jgi:hypothetical protein
MEREHLALDGLLRELARAPRGDDDAFVSALLARTRRSADPRKAVVAAAALLIAMAFAWAFAPDAPTGRIEFSRQACLVPDAVRMRILLKEAESDSLLLLGEVPIGGAARVPADAPLLLQAVGRDGLARWTAPAFTRVRKSPPLPAPQLDRKSARTVEFARDVKPILEQHCSGCHADGELVHAAVKPFEARNSPLVTQVHAPLSAAERHQLALWVDLGAAGRP